MQIRIELGYRLFLKSLSVFGRIGGDTVDFQQKTVRAVQFTKI